MYHFLFIDHKTGEEFLVGAYLEEEAYEIAIDNFGNDVELIDVLPEYLAEASGLDEY